MSNQFLRDCQMDAVNKMKNGCILNGGVGTGKSRTGLYYYFNNSSIGCPISFSLGVISKFFKMVFPISPKVFLIGR